MGSITALGPTDVRGSLGPTKSSSGESTAPTISPSIPPTSTTTHPNHWTHGFQPPTTAFKFYPSKKLANRLTLNTIQGKFFKPMAVLELVGHKSIHSDNHHSIYEDNDASDSYTDLLYPQTNPIQAFSSHFSLPKVSLNVPSLKNANDVIDHFQNDISRLIYHNFYAHDDIILCWGGLYNNEYSCFSKIGLPANVDIAKVSVYFPVDLPPFIDRDILMSPYLSLNKHLYLFNPDRSTITLLDAFTSNLPDHLCSCSFAKISDRHVFIYGGFEVKIVRVYHDDTTDRWIVEKDLVLNEDGYIMDTITFKFVKVPLVKSENEDFSLGRLGNGITANVYNEVSYDDTVSSFAGSAQFNNFTDSSYYSPYIPAKLDRDSTTKLDRESVKDGTKSPATKKKNILSEPGTPTSSSGSMTQKLTKTKSVGSKDSKRERSNSNGGKKHRDISHLHSSSPIGKSTSPNYRQSSPLPVEFQQAVGIPAHLQSSYSNQVKQHRSNSGSLNSRPVSPQPQQPTAVRPNFSKIITFDGSELDDDIEATDVFGETPVKPTHSLTSVFIFGGFIETMDGGIKKYVATNDFLRIDLICEGPFFMTNFHKVARIFKIAPSIDTPSPRGYFASTLIDLNENHDEECDWTNPRPFSPNDEESSNSSIQTSNSRHHNKITKILTPEEFFSQKGLLVQGGCDNEKRVFSDMFVFRFGTQKWESLDTFTYDYFDQQQQPMEDKDLVSERQNLSPNLVEAELRACHHQAIFYNNFGKQLVIFVGGFRSDFLKYVDEEPYVTDKLDVSCLNRMKLAAKNFDTCRVLVFNVKTQTWGFSRFYYDLRKNISHQAFEDIKDNPMFIDANLVHHGAGFALNGRILTICQGLITVVPEDEENFKKCQDMYTSMLFGCHLQISFPSI